MTLFSDKTTENLLTLSEFDSRITSATSRKIIVNLSTSSESKKTTLKICRLLVKTSDC